jgi:hypothetical protein
MKAIEIKIASPCSARWEDMEGDDRSRFCQHCHKNVYNFTQMSAIEVGALIQEKEGRVCARIYQRTDGKALAENCPRGLARVSRRIKVMACSALAFLLLAGVALARKRNSKAVTYNPQGPIMRKVDKTIGTVKEWIGIQPTPMLVGEICVPMPPTATTNAYNKKPARRSK